MKQQLLYKTPRQIAEENKAYQKGFHYPLHKTEKIQDFGIQTKNILKNNLKSLFSKPQPMNHSTLGGFMGVPYPTFANPILNRTSPESIVGGWKELGRVNGSTLSSLDLSSIANKRYLQILHSRTALSASTFEELTKNADTGSTYAQRASEDGVADFTRNTQTNINYLESSVAVTTPAFSNYYIENLSSEEKLGFGQYVLQSTAGASNTPHRGNNYFKWTNTSDALDQLTLTPQSGTINGEMIVLGYDPTDVHVDGFWELNGTASGTTALADITLNNAKKYNWIQAWWRNGSTADMKLQFGNGSLDTGSNYSDRYSFNGGADTTRTSQSGITMSTGWSSDYRHYLNGFVVNNSANEKLFFGHVLYWITSGAGTAPARYEICGKWTNTSNQFNHFGIVLSTGSFHADSECRVWSSN